MIRMLTTTGLCLAAAQPLSAATFTAAPHAQHMIDLDTAPGHFSVWNANDLSGLNAVRAHFRVSAVARDNKWGPIFRFQLKRGDELVQVSLMGFPGKKPLLIQLDHSKGGVTQPPEAFVTFMQVEELADLEIDWTADGQVTFTLKSPESLQVSPQGERHMARLSGTPTGFSIVGSTGEIEVQSLGLGTSG